MALSLISFNTGTVNGTSLTVTAPASIADDDILIFIRSCRVRTTETYVWPSGFTEFDSIHPPSFGEVTAAWKRASSESGDYTVTWDNSDAAIGVVVCIRGAVATGTPFTVGTGVSATTNEPDPPSVDPGSSDDRMAVCWVGAALAGPTFSPPSGYTEQVDAAYSTLASITVATKLYTGQSENPGIFTASASIRTGTNTLILDPAAAAAPVFPYYKFLHNIINGS